MAGVAGLALGLKNRRDILTPLTTSWFRLKSLKASADHLKAGQPIGKDAVTVGRNALIQVSMAYSSRRMSKG